MLACSFLQLQALPQQGQTVAASNPASSPDRRSQSPSPSTPAQATTADPQTLIDPNELVLRALHHSIWGPGFVCKVRQKTTLYGREIHAIGTCAQAGNGTGRLKVSLKLSMEGDVRNSEQICDGRVLWTDLGNSYPFRTVNLDSIRTNIAKKGKWDPKNPDLDLSLGIGGQMEVLRMLYIKYRWYKAWKGSMDGIAVWQLVGTTRTQAPPILPNTKIDNDALAVNQDPFPTEVRLTLARDSSENLFPYRIEYYQRVKEPSKQEEILEPLSVIEYFELQTPLLDREGLFQIQIPEDFRDREDETGRYLLNG
ncbi:MAG: hypothetical protein U0905_19475 [Pirellulales bacterium]